MTADHRDTAAGAHPARHHPLHGVANGYTIELQNPQPVLAVQSTGYVANAQTDQGTMRFYGEWTDLFNSSRNIDAFLDFRGPSPDAVRKATSDERSMIASIL